LHNILEKLRTLDVKSKVGILNKPSDLPVLEEYIQTGTKFVVSSDSSVKLENVYYDAIYKLMDCILPNEAGDGILQEGGIYYGCWLESTGTINAEILSRFIPSVAEKTYEQFIHFQREDGLLPYKITATGPVFKQIQLVTPLVRSVWNHYLLNGRDNKFLSKMYNGLVKYDEWLATYRNTRETGCVEAFCTFDTGHDLSARFWHVPDTPYLDDPARYDPDSPILPFLAPDLTANVYCSRKYYDRMAQHLNDTTYNWVEKSEETMQSLMKECYDAQDHFFYDVDRSGKFVRIQSDVLLRVLACEVGDGEFFESALRQYLLNTRKFFAKYPLTSLSMDDPRFDPHSEYNSWCGTTNFLSIIRTPHAFEYHGRFVELTWILQPMISTISRLKRFAQCVSPWTGEEGFTEVYSPAILSVLDYIERLCGILPTPEGELWFTGLLPSPMDHGEKLADQTAYSRTVELRTFELVNTREYGEIYMEGQSICKFPYGIRVVTNRKGELKSIIGMSVRMVEGTLEYRGKSHSIRIEGNEKMDYIDGIFQSVYNPGVVLPNSND
jgi:hypothetical protein